MKRAITLHNFLYFFIEKIVLDIHIRDVMSKLECSRLNGVAVIAKTYTHTHYTAELR